VKPELLGTRLRPAWQSVIGTLYWIAATAVIVGIVGLAGKLASDDAKRSRLDEIIRIERDFRDIELDFVAAPTFRDARCRCRHRALPDIEDIERAALHSVAR